MPQIDGLRTLAWEHVDPIPPSWPHVYYLLISHSARAGADLGAIVAASGETLVFSYGKESIEPMYCCTVGGTERLVTLTGYRASELRTSDPEEAFGFIRAAVDAGRGLFVAGPEAGLCYGYEDGGEPLERIVHGASPSGGPAINGAVPWEPFSRFVRAFGEAEGYAYVERVSGPESAEHIVDLLAETVVTWQDHHPGADLGQRQECYGVAAFRRFVEDVRDPERRSKIDDAYTRCHLIEFQIGGRYWLGHYLERLASACAEPVRERVAEIGARYVDTAMLLSRFKESKVSHSNGERRVQEAVLTLEQACETEARIVDGFASLRGIV
ncbi:MAG: hypothetical protein ACLFUA_00825 [Spirochaetales bacterium]